MSKPSVKQVGSVFTFTWAEGVVARIDHVRRHTNGNISSEVTVKSNRPGVAPHVYHGDMSNMLGPRIRADVVKGCNARVNDLDWEQMIETVCEHVIERFRQGKQPILLADVETKDALRWRLFPYLLEREPTVLFGRGGSGKSTLSAWMAIRVALGIDAEPGNVAVIDWETNEDDWREMVSMVAAGIGLPDPGTNIIYIEGNEPLAHGVEEYLQMVKEFNTDLAIIDSAGFATGGEPENAGATMEYFRALRTFGCTTLTIAHQRAEDMTKNHQKPFGSIYWENSPRATFQVVRSEEEADMEFEAGVYQRKKNKRPVKPKGYKFTFQVANEYQYTEGDSVTISETAITEIPDLASTASNPDRILALLKGGRMDAPEMAMEMNLDITVVRATLHRMKGQGRVEQLNDGYGLPAGTFVSG